MLNINNWMDQYFAQNYQILCKFHYSNQAIHYFVYKGMSSPNNSVVMEEKNLLYSKLLKKLRQISKKDNIKRYTGILYGLNHFATCDILLSHKIIIIIDRLFLN